ncbi:MAG: HAMP domain-containing histidine kinase [Prevotellaceae bacterium]|nr:HAMP domain-containing histidine kinase [Prevotellaceae bacterium]
MEEIPLWNKFNSNKKILPDDGETETSRFITSECYDEHEKKNVLCRILYSKIQVEGKEYVLSIFLNIYEAKKIIQFGTAFQLIFFFTLLLGFVVITHLLYKKLWKPFYQTLSDIETFNIRNSEIPSFPVNDIREFSQLNQAVETLIANSVQAYKIQKEFTENASHEMQTPLAVFQSKLDIMLQQQDLSENQIQIMQLLYEATSRLTRINKNLLLLAKIDNLQFFDTQELNVAEILDNTLSFLMEQSEANRITTAINISNKNLMLQANKTLSESLINNLITNAIKHNIPDGNLSIELEQNMLIVSNTGTEKSLDQEMLFRRFGRMNEKVKGSGLGLAIVKQICIQYGWDITYDYENDTHRFTIVFN